MTRGLWALPVAVVALCIAYVPSYAAGEAPRVTSESVSNIQPEEGGAEKEGKEPYEVTLAAGIETHGSETSYSFVVGYSPCGECEMIVREEVGRGVIASEEGVQTVTGHLKHALTGVRYTYWLQASSAGGETRGPVMQFVPDQPPIEENGGVAKPTIEDEASEEVGEDSSNLLAAINAHGSSSRYAFWLESCRPGPDCQRPEKMAVGEGSVTPGDEPVIARVQDLEPGRTYTYWVQASDAAGRVEGIHETFTMAPAPRIPAASTDPASEVTASGATLNAIVSSDGATITGCSFDFGPSATYGKSAPCESLPPSTEASTQVKASLSGLTPGVAYHDRVVISSQAGAVYGGDSTFVTAEPLAGAGSPGGMPNADLASTAIDYPTAGFPEALLAVAAYASSSQPTPSPSSSASLVGRSLRASPSGVVTVLLRCPPTGTNCTGAIALNAVLFGEARSARHTGRRERTISSGSYKLAAGTIEPLALRLVGAAREILRRRHTMTVTVNITGHGAHVGSLITATKAPATLRYFAPSAPARHHF